MGKLAPSHRGSLAHKPPLEALNSSIERTPHHWFWLGEFLDDGLERWPMFKWAEPDRDPGYFSVSRLLWQFVHPGHPRRLLLENTCGLYTCINPAHWRMRGT